MKYKNKLKNLAARIAKYEQIKSKGGFTKPGSNKT